MKKEIYNLTVEPITCVHVGTGEKLTPMDYAVRKTSDKSKGRVQYSYIRYSPDKLLKRIATDKDKMREFNKATESGDIKKLYTFCDENWTSKEILYLCTATREFLSKYKENKNPLDNAMEVLEMYHSAGRYEPVIPGSSIKGAVRTGVLNCFFKTDRQKLDEARRYKKDLDIGRFLLGNYKDAKSDPFRAVEISDCKFKPAGTQLMGMVKNISRAPRDRYVLQSNSIQVIAEALKGTMLNPDVNGVCRLRINGDLQKSKSVTKAISADIIRNSCNDFFKKKFDEEYEKFYNDIVSGETEYIEELKKEIEEIAKSDDAFVLRVGRWSQIDFMTYEGKGKTRSVFDYNGQYLPLGWCKCTLKKAGAAEANQ